MKRIHPAALVPLAVALSVPAALAVGSTAATATPVHQQPGGRSHVHLPSITRPAGDEPEGIVWNPGNHTVWVASESPGEEGAGGDATEPARETVQGQLHIFSSRMRLIRKLTMASDAEYLAVDSGLGTKGYVYVANQAAKPGPVISVYNAATRRLLAKIPVRRLVGVAIDPTTHQIFASSRGKSNPEGQRGTIRVYSGITHRRLAIIPAGDDPESIAVNPVTHLVYAANEDEGTITVANTLTHRVVKTIDLYPGQSRPPGEQAGPEPQEADKLAINPVTNRIYITDDADHVFVISGQTNQVLRKIRIPGSRARFGEYSGGVSTNNIAVLPSEDLIFVVSEGNYFTVLNGRTFHRTRVVVSHARNSHLDAITVSDILRRVYLTDEVRGTVTEVKLICHCRFGPRR